MKGQEMARTKTTGIFMKASESFKEQLAAAAEGLGLNKTQVVETALALAFPAYFVGGMPTASTRQNTRTKLFSPESRSEAGEESAGAVGSAASCFADLAAGNPGGNSEDRPAIESHEGDRGR
jgi:hypothetical protein